jgi:cation transport ATPase
MMEAAHPEAVGTGPKRAQGILAIFTLAAIGLSLALRWSGMLKVEVAGVPLQDFPLVAVLIFGGIPLLIELAIKVAHREFGSDLLAGISIITAALLQEYLAGSLVVLMLSGGEALEAYAVRNASSVLQALAKRMPSVAHGKRQGKVVDLDLEQVAVGDILVVFPHEVCPVDGTVIEGHGTMDESYLTGEPYLMSKTPGSGVLSGAVNGDRP